MELIFARKIIIQLFNYLFISVFNYSLFIKIFIRGQKEIEVLCEEGGRGLEKLSEL